MLALARLDRSFAAPPQQLDLAAFADGAAPVEGRVVLTLPELAENGNIVPLRFAVESPMTEADYVVTVLILADGNPRPAIARFHFSPESGRCEAETRIRLAATQNVAALARMSGGRHFFARSLVKVTIGGCG